MVKDPTLFEQLTPYIASAVVAVVSLWLGKLWERRSGDRAWLREQRLRASAELIEGVYECERVANEFVRFDGDDGSGTRWSGVIDAVGHVQRKHAQLEVVGPKMLAESGEALVKAQIDMTESINSREKLTAVVQLVHSDVEVAWPEHARMNSLLNEFVTTARASITSER